MATGFTFALYCTAGAQFESKLYYLVLLAGCGLPAAFTLLLLTSGGLVFLLSHVDVILQMMKYLEYLQDSILVKNIRSESLGLLFTQESL